MDDRRIQLVKQRLKQKQSEIWDEYDSYPTPELFHFTTPCGFRGITEKRQLWCTDIRYVNDSREGDHGMSVIRSVMQRKSIYKPFKDSVLAAESLFGMKINFTAYICCFCSAGEQEYMWRDYAAAGTGCALVFDHAALISASEGGKRYGFLRVMYDPDKQVRQVEQTLDHAIHLERELGTSGRSARMRYWLEVLVALFTCAIRFKDAKWRQENELRIFIAEGPGVTPFNAADKPRVSVAFEPHSLKRVIRGPAAANDLITEKIKDLLDQNGSEAVPVVNSSIKKSATLF